MDSEKLRIMFLASHLTNSSGGTKFIFLLAKELSKKHHLTLFLQKTPTFFKNELEDANIDIKIISDCSTGDLKFWLTFPNQIKKQIKYLKNESQKYDVAISIIFPMNILANSINLPHVQHCFQPFAFFWDSILISKLPISQRIFLKIMKKLYGKLDIMYTKKSNIISTPTQEVSNYVKEFYGKDSVPTSAGVDLIFKPSFNSTLKKKYLEQKILIHSTDWTFTKNTNWLIDQFIEISKKIKNIKLLITEIKNSGSERDLAIQKIKKYNLNIELCGFIPESLLPDYYSIADLGIYTGVAFKNSAASLWVLECMACETPVLRTNNTNSEIEHGKTGYLFDIDNPQEFQKYIITLLENDDLRNKFGKSAREFILNHRTWEQIAKLFAENCFYAIDDYKSKF